GGNITLVTQPANSPDLNVLDLVLCHSIQRLKDDVDVTNAAELVEATIEVLNQYAQETLEYVWHCLWLSMAKS
ncbi:unnamed protein product, partial [Discosporangium mesarthrocarpum]